MSHPRKRHASMMENQKKAAEAEAAQTILTAVSSVSAPDSGENSASDAGVVESELTSANEVNSAPSATHATATAPVQHEDFGEESSDDSESGIAFLSPTVGAPSVGKKTRGPAKEKGAKTNNTAAAAAAVMSLQRTHWTKEMDALLLHIVPIYDAKDWVSIAKHMGGDVTNEQCRNRWCCKVDPSLNTNKMGPWEPEEEEQLKVLITQFTNHPEQDKRGRRRYRDSVHWGAVAKELNRSQKDCRSKWTTMQRSITIQEMRKGPFTPEEDNLVLQRVAEWGDKGQGVWKSLEVELGRPSNNIGNRYRKLIKTYSTTTGENGVVVTPLNVHSYLPIEQERKLAVALAPVTSSTHASSGDNEGNTGENNDGSEALAVSEEEFLEAATAAAVLAGKKRGRPRSNPLPILTSAHLMSNNNNNNGSDGGSMMSGDGTGSKRLRGAELAETIALAAGHLTNGTQNSNTSYNTNNTSNNGSSGSSSGGGAIPANVPINASAEVAAGRTKIGRSSFWNEERDGLLVEAVAQFGNDWNSISAHVGEGANCDRCWQRWNRYLKPDAMVSKTDPWTTDDLIRLEDLVLTHTNNPDKRRAGRSTTKTSIDWTTISLLMKRPYMDCKGKWKKIKAFNMKKGPFSAEEDALIVQRVEEVGLSMGAASTGRVAEPVDPSDPAHTQTSSAAFPAGFWEHLSAETNRPPEILRTRVKTLRARGSNVL
uniref:Uncharacterized protein n=1 Tax=Spumella elongata TaxID=89044 RepID=A0A7S3HL51_9STRA|mmetsp:Transcript_57246/g.100534  ORF Transcript_57246/g.100534 Transcript_57246/m.100534 type:complete len:709 (+) Transcript_57246:91-2217(+)|eukprot:CAMPEP_0184993414 /NCGR_PEP_ID=MMETSP1098-20130426/45547_1 /TAXON_ID=89044 /ORGANISM="Spumella elongata, Strain CCAP 955/1" /LENGTH=708 /DNA_ID=CAMNT_0027519247 /DNA_START=80 /DNA_END=2206 /DNA_ORIENTATION=-